MKTIEHKEESIIEECRRIRDQLDEEYAKDPEKYWEKLYKRQEEMKAEGVKFRTKPSPPYQKKQKQLWNSIEKSSMQRQKQS